ncbi:MAG: ATP-binding cassette domain-containing protein [Proteobacteria bacterium]|nr:ATP-binding cassette domain-containing protein [Pseudomonadota bacterium]
MNAVVQFDQVSKHYDALAALDGVSLSIVAGSTTAIVGESGCGKTTLLEMINGVVAPDSGAVEVFGLPIPQDALASFRRRIGYAVQGAGLFPHMTNQQNVTLIARLEQWSETDIRTRYLQLLTEMGLPEGVSDRYPRQLSGGQQQRVGLCRALMLKPDLLLLDEPFSAVDPITRVGIYEQFEKVRQSERVTALLVTHDMREAVRLADQLVIMRAGKVVQAGPTQTVISTPAEAYVDFLVRGQL